MGASILEQLGSLQGSANEWRANVRELQEFQSHTDVVSGGDIHTTVETQSGSEVAELINVASMYYAEGIHIIATSRRISMECQDRILSGEVLAEDVLQIRRLGEHIHTQMFTVFVPFHNWLRKYSPELAEIDDDGNDDWRWRFENEPTNPAPTCFPGSPFLDSSDSWRPGDRTPRRPVFPTNPIFSPRSTA